MNVENGFRFLNVALGTVPVFDCKGNGIVSGVRFLANGHAVGDLLGLSAADPVKMSHIVTVVDVKGEFCAVLA